MSATRAAVIATLLAALPPAVAADAIRPLDRLRVAAGPFAKDNDLRLRLDASDGRTGDEFSTARDLGFDGSARESFRELAVSWDREHQLHLRRFAFSESGGGAIRATLAVGDDEWPVGAVAEGRLRVAVEAFGHVWYPLSDERRAVGIGLGAVRYAVSGHIDARVDGEDAAADFRARFGESAWAPQIGVEASALVDDRWRAGFGAGWVRRNGGSLSGTAFGASLRIEWFPWQHAGLSLRWQHNDLDLEAEREDLRGRLRFRTNGPLVLATLRY